ncbi:unnamed protein product [Meloidogyne enterolobii]|uniref:Uncharacterized protein n=1 Tax=Meloidogyne enterolobii TaxID=390850 RepID=A0ACB0XXS3_MELEN
MDRNIYLFDNEIFAFRINYRSFRKYMCSSFKAIYSRIRKTGIDFKRQWNPI